jgi:hypothetical protein
MLHSIRTDYSVISFAHEVLDCMPDQISACIGPSSEMVVSPSAANGGVTAFPAWQYFYNDFSICSAYAAASSAYQCYNCYCQQKFFDALFDCDSEERLCLGSGMEPDPHLSLEVSM